MAFYTSPTDKQSGDGLALTEWNDLSNAVAGGIGLTLALNPEDRVGIGLKQPDATLDVARGNARSGTALFRGTNQASHFNYADTEHTYIRGGKSGSHVLINDVGGDVGVGKQNPGASLDVARGNANGGTAIFRGTKRHSHFNYADTEHTYIRGGKSSSHVLINDGGGNVGIGLGANGLDEKLVVKGNVKATKFIGDGSQLTNLNVGELGKLRIAPASNGRGLDVLSPTAGNTHFPWTNNWNYISGKGLILRNESHQEKFRFDLSTGRMGIGSTSTDAKLQVIHQSQNANGNAFIIGPINGSNLRMGYHTDYSWIQSHGSKPLSINPVGNNVGIGTTSPDRPLTVQADAGGECIRLLSTSGHNYSPSNPYWDIKIYRGDTEGDTFPELGFLLNGKEKAYIDNDGTWKKGSDRRLKTGIGPLENILEKVCALTPSSYHFKDGSTHGAKSIGFIAQDVEQIFPELVKKKGEMRSLGYDNFAVLAIAAIKEQQKLIEALTKQVSALSGK